MKRTVLLSAVFAGSLAAGTETTLPSDTSRPVVCHSDDILSVKAQVNFATLVQFADNDTVVGAFWGDKERWSVDQVNNLIVVKPSSKGTATDLHVVTSSGAVCSFSLKEVSNDAGQQADLKLRVTTPAEVASKPVFYSAQQMDAVKADATAAKAALQQEQDRAKKVVAQAKEDARAKQESSVQLGYKIEQNAKAAEAFHVKGMYRANGFTYIECDPQPQESGSVYEVKDGKPSLVQFELHEGRYVIPKLIDDGYLLVGKKTRMNFHWEG